MKISFHNAWHKKLMAKLGMLTILSTVFFLAMACASIPQETSVAGLFDQFEKTPQLLVRANTMFLRDMVASFDDATIESILTPRPTRTMKGARQSIEIASTRHSREPTPSVLGYPGTTLKIRPRKSLMIKSWLSKWSLPATSQVC